MKAIKSLAVAALAAASLVASADSFAAGGHWTGASRGHWNGGGHWGGSRWYGPRIGLYVGAPLLWGSYYWGYPYDYYYPRSVVVERVIERDGGDSYPEGRMESMPPPAEMNPSTAPTQGPAYMNYCESSRAYFPKVTSCPEGWKFIPSR